MQNGSFPPHTFRPYPPPQLDGSGRFAQQPDARYVADHNARPRPAPLERQTRQPPYYGPEPATYGRSATVYPHVMPGHAGVAYPSPAPTDQLPVHPEQVQRGWPTDCSVQRQRAPLKKALLIGCNYPRFTRHRLKSCVNDAVLIKYALIEKFNYRPENVRILIDEAIHGEPFCLPTRRGIIENIRWLTQDLERDDRLFFHFSGHGTCSVDYSKEEGTGTNQCLVPTDYASAGVIVDDDLNRLLVRPLPPGSVLHSLVDCCHSGTIMDLQFSAKSKGKWKDTGSTMTYKGTAGGSAFQFAACRDEQKAYEKENGQFSCGAATVAFVEAVKNGENVTYRNVWEAMKAAVSESTKPLDVNRTIFQKLRFPIGFAAGGYLQSPVLSANTGGSSLDDPMHL